ESQDEDAGSALLDDPHCEQGSEEAFRDAVPRLCVGQHEHEMDHDGQAEGGQPRAAERTHGHTVTGAGVHNGVMSTGTIQELDRDECRELLGVGRFARIAFSKDGRLELLPVNYAYDDDTIMLRT